MSKLLDVYMRYKHLDKVFTDRDFCSQNFSGAVIFNLWDAVREHVTAAEERTEHNFLEEIKKGV